jgi:salicylate hydroxylase
MEDALVLAGCVAHDSDIPAAFGTYASLRRDRTRRVQAASVRQGRIYRLAPPLSQARDAVFRAAPAALIMSRLDWLYGWRPAR